jgi:hypothetical protein
MPDKAGAWLEKLVATAAGRHDEARAILRDLEEQRERLDALIEGHAGVVARLRGAIEAGEAAMSQAARAGGTEPLAAMVQKQAPAYAAAAAELEDAVAPPTAEPVPAANAVGQETEKEDDNAAV